MGKAGWYPRKLVVFGAQALTKPLPESADCPGCRTATIKISAGDAAHQLCLVFWLQFDSEDQRSNSLASSGSGLSCMKIGASASLDPEGRSKTARIPALEEKPRSSSNTLGGARWALPIA